MCIYGLDFRHEKYYIIIRKISFIWQLFKGLFIFKSKLVLSIRQFHYIEKIIGELHVYHDVPSIVWVLDFETVLIKEKKNTHTQDIAYWLDWIIQTLLLPVTDTCMSRTDTESSYLIYLFIATYLVGRDEITVDL